MVIKAHNRKRPCVNSKNGKCSHFVLYDRKKRFRNNTQVKDFSASDTDNGFDFHAIIVWVAPNGRRAALRLRVKPHAVALAFGAAGDLPTGDISVTLDNGPPV